MILRSLRLAGWRCFADPIEIGPFGEGLNVVYGPNGSGKSTLVWALARGLFDRHSITGADVESLQPWGKGLTPTITIEFAHKDIEYRLHKRFLRSKTSELARRENGVYSAFKDGREADEWTRKLLANDEVDKGTKTDPKRHWGFAQVLWATQGALQIVELSDGTRNTIRDSLGAQVAGAGADVLERLITERFGQVFTKTGNLKGGAGAPPVVALQIDHDKLIEERETIASRVTELETAQSRVEELRISAEKYHDEQRQREREIAELQSDVATYTDLAHKRELLTRDVASANETYVKYRDQVNELRELKIDLASFTEEVNRRRENLAAEKERVATLSASITAANEQIATVRQEQEEINRADDLARMAEKFVQAKGQVAEDEKLAKLLIEVDRNIGECEEKIAQTAAPSADDIKQMRKLESDRLLLQAQIDAAQIQVQVVAHAPLGIEVTAGEPRNSLTLAEQHEYTLKGSPKVVVEIAGIATIRATGPATSLDKLHNDLREIQRELAELTIGYPTNDIDRLDELTNTLKGYQTEIEKLDGRRAGLVSNRSEENILHDLARNREYCRSCCEDHPTWHDNPPDAQKLRSFADDAQSRWRIGFVAANEELNKASGIHAEADRQLGIAIEQLNGKEADLARLVKRRDELISGEVTAQEQDQELQLDQRALDLRAKRRELSQVNEKLAEFADDPRVTAQTLDGQRNSLRKKVEDSQQLLVEANTRMNILAEEGLQSQLNEKDEQIARLKDEIEREWLSYRSISLLHDTLVAERTRATELLLLPVQQRATRTLQRIVGNRFQRIDFDEAISPNGVTPAVDSQTVALDYLSGGEQEQVHFAVRLALAEIAFGNSRQLVVFDDAFTATDPVRHARIVKILEETAQRFQVVVLSCHPDRYAHLHGVKSFDLVQISSRAAKDRSE